MVWESGDPVKCINTVVPVAVIRMTEWSSFRVEAAPRGKAFSAPSPPFSAPACPLSDRGSTAHTCPRKHAPPVTGLPWCRFSFCPGGCPTFRLCLSRSIATQRGGALGQLGSESPGRCSSRRLEQRVPVSLSDSAVCVSPEETRVGRLCLSGMCQS